ncbi:hypothetical protein BHE74_00055186 [Ensete ventricosum]|nr:hypothetical protein BHE74_00055186 [Ensete ventricosum]RZS15604.1 hypothetical protein BHM03_00047481 [Ensete ventricosum]
MRVSIAVDRRRVAATWQRLGATADGGKKMHDATIGEEEKAAVRLPAGRSGARDQIRQQGTEAGEEGSIRGPTEESKVMGASGCSALALN